MEDRLEGIRFNARSLGGIGTTLSFPEMDLTIDLGICTPTALRTGTVAFTHTHADHLSGLPAYLGVRRLFGMKDPRLIVPAPVLSAFRDLIASLGALQGRPFEPAVEGMDSGTDMPLGNDLFLHPFRTEHGIPCLGLSVVRRVAKLKDEFLGLAGPEIARLRKEGNVDMFRVEEDPLVAVSGDSLIAEMDLDDPLVRRARVLFIESTFVDDKRSIEHAHLGGHTHLDELGEHLQGVECRAIVLFHFSQIYKTREIERAVRDRLPESLSSRVHVILPEEGDRL
ncbi:MAG: hypothetical protein GXP54_08800 [Deltaproteobacteria bacterium]|nr:hypothetical protein [Deltaproteobacteria bacterium]